MSSKRMALLGTAVEKLVALPDDRFGTVKDFLVRIADNKGWDSAKRYLRGENPWPEVKAVAKKAASKLLNLVTNIELSEIERFSVKDVIKSGEINGVKFRFGPNFRRVFGSLEETAVPAAVMSFYRLKESSFDEPILKELGGAKQARAFLAHAFTLAVRQGLGQKGVLLTDGQANVFYIQDPNNPGIYWPVNFHSYSVHGEWVVEAAPITPLNKWYTCPQFVSCDSGS